VGSRVAWSPADAFSRTENIATIPRQAAQARPGGVFGGTVGNGALAGFAQ
jgi:hypothetical protein